MLAALASAAMPQITVAAVRGGYQANATDDRNGIDYAIVQDAAGKPYDVYVSDTDAGRKRLSARVRAARALDEAREPNGLGFGLDQVLAFEDGERKNSPTGTTAVLVTGHYDGAPRNLDLLTFDDCSAIGTAIGAIHRLNPAMLRTDDYPRFSTGQIHAQLTAWIRRLRSAGHIPPEITGSWERIIETEGLWSFGTCFVHGGFSDGDVLFSGSTITAITNWQGMQTNDPARDLAWIFAKLDEEHRNAVLSAYGRIMGSRLDDLIMLRANLWLQMEQVGEFIQALSRADNVKIMQFKAQVDRLAHQLGVATQRIDHAEGAQRAAKGDQRSPSTITVGTLLHEGERRRAAAARQAPAATEPAAGIAGAQDDTGEQDRTDSAQVTAADPTGGSRAETDSTADRPVVGAAGATGGTRTTDLGNGGGTAGHRSATSPTIVVTQLDQSTLRDGIASELDDETGDSQPQAAASFPAGGATADPMSTATIVIPLLEQEERALRDAQAGLDSRNDADGHAPESSGVPNSPETSGTPKA